MRKKQNIIWLLLIITLMIFGWNPFAPYRDTTDVLTDSYNALETGVTRQGNGIYIVKALTRMPLVKAKMVEWWFSDYLQTTEQYKRWHPTAHIWMDWENKFPGKVIGASHLVHEYIGQDLQKLRIQFINPSEFLDSYEQRNDRFVICAKVGDLEVDINFTSMCHIVRDTAWGAEMRSIFWLGNVAKRQGNDQIFSIEGLVGNTALARFILINEELAKNLMIHAIEEMGYLSNFLPQLYLQQTSPGTSLNE